jgi:hypothetical protein
MSKDDDLAEIPDVKETEVVDDLMDNVAALLKSQMRTANQHVRRRAARLFSTSRMSPGGDRSPAVN